MAQNVVLLTRMGVIYPESFRRHYQDLINTPAKRPLLINQDLPQLYSLSHLTSFLDVDWEDLIGNASILSRVPTDTLLYEVFTLKKKSGGDRFIEAPKAWLRGVQDRIYSKILRKISISPFAMAYTSGRSILSNAQMHLNARVMYSLDLKDFFTSITFKQVFRFFLSLGYAGHIALILARFCIYIPRQWDSASEQWVLIDGTTPFLPQGAPTSPAISNLISLLLDQQMHHLSQKFGFRYSRYADDITISSEGHCDITHIFREEIKKVIERAGFTINIRKQRISKSNGYCREICGIIVHPTFLALPRIWRKKLRAGLHELKRLLPCSRKEHPYLQYLQMSLHGRVSFAIHVNQGRYQHFKDEFERILKLQPGGG